MGLRTRLAHHRKDHRFIGGGLVALLLIATGLFYLVQRGRDLPTALVTNRVLLFVLWYANVVLIVVVLFVLLRNVIKLLVERRHRVLGSTFKFKLVATYCLTCHNEKLKTAGLVLEKLDATGRTDAVAHAARLGVIHL